MKKIKLPILLSGLLSVEKEKQILALPDNDPFEDNQKRNYFGPNGRWLLNEVLKSLDLKRSDTITILTTSNETYVSICVSVIAFNFAQISRVVTDRTKVVIVIHEYGYVYPKIEKMAAQWREKKIVVIEDCAHIIGVNISAKKVGSFGDFALFSLPKIIPASSGGLLRTKRKIKLSSLDIYQKEMKGKGVKAAENFLTKFNYFNQERIKRTEIITKILKKPDQVFKPTKLGVPFFVGVKTKNKKKYQFKNPWIEYGGTLRDDILYIPTNPLIEEKIFKKISF